MPTTPSLMHVARSAKTRLVTMMVLFVMAVSALMAYLVGHFVQSRMEPAIGVQHHLLMQGVGKRIDQELADRIDDLRALGEAVAPVLAADRATIKERLGLAPTLTHQFWNVGLIDLQGNVIADLRDPSGRRINLSDREYFKQALRTAKPVVSDPLQSSATGKPMAVIIAPLVIDGTVKAFVAGGIDLDGQQLVRTLLGADEGNGLLMLVTADGIIISHPNPEFIMRPAVQVLGADALSPKPIRKGDGWTIGLDPKGQMAVFASVKLRYANWTAIGSYPYQEEFSTLETVRDSAIAIAIVIALITGGVAAAIAYQFVAPVQQLQRDVAQLEQGQLDPEVLKSQRQDEIGALSNQFHRLVTSREANERRARQQELFVRTLLASAPDAVILADQSGAVLEWNRQAEELFGFSQSEAIGKNVADLIVPPSSREAHLRGMARLVQPHKHGVKVGPARLTGLRKDGTQVVVELTLSHIEREEGSAALAFIRDVTMQIAHEETLAFSERRLKMIADNVPALIAYVDNTEHYRFSNAHYQRTLGIEPESMIGRTVRDVLGPSTYENLRGHIQTALQGNGVHFETTRTDLPTTSHFMADFIPDTDANGVTHGFYTLVTDITERKEAEMRQAASERHAAAANRAKSEFVANISHEIRTPMNAVLGIAQLLENTPLQNEQREYVGIIRASGLSLIAILNDVLDFSKIEAGRMELEHERYDVEAIVDSAAALLSANAVNKDIEVLVGVGAEVPRFLIGDFVRVQQIVTNLLSNAVKFTQAGYVSMFLDVDPDGEWLTLAIDDTGLGITQDQQQRIFESFTQADASTTRKFGGTGLGLTITRRLISMMAGEIALTSSPGEGSLFKVRLPLQRAAQELVKPFSSATFLLIDESDRSRQLFVRTCAYCGYLAYAYPSLSELRLAISRSGLRLMPVSHVMLSSQYRSQANAIREALLAEGLSSGACMYLVNTPFERSTQGELRPSAIFRLIQKPLTPKVLRKLVEQAETTSRPPVSTEFHLSNLRILLVEDNPVNQLITKAMLAGKVRVLEVANNGAEAVAVLRTRNDEFDVVLMDVQMPVMDGIEATRVIRDELRLSIPIVAMTAGVFNEEVERCNAAGMNEFLPKPVAMEDLFDLLQRLASTTTQRPTDLIPAPTHDLPVFSPTMLQAILDKSPALLDFVASTVKEGLTRTRQELLKLEVVLAAGDDIQAGKLLHSMCGTLGNLGAHLFADQTLHAQRHLQEGRKFDLLLLGDSIDEFAREVDHWLSQRKTEPINVSITKTWNIDEFADLLRAHNYRAVEVFERVKTDLRSRMSQNAFESLANAVATLRFEDALSSFNSENVYRGN